MRVSLEVLGPGGLRSVWDQGALVMEQGGGVQSTVSTISAHLGSVMPLGV